MDAYVGFRRHAEAPIGPEPGWVAHKAQDGEWTLEQHLLALITDHERYSGHNITVMDRSAGRRGAGIYLLRSSIFGYALAYIDILWEVEGG